MEKRMQYSKRKFTRFSTEKKIRVVTSFLEQIVDNWNELEVRKRLLSNLSEVIGYLEKEEHTDLKHLFENKEELSESMNLVKFVEFAKPFMDKHSRGVRDTDILPRTDTKLSSDMQSKIPLYALFENIRSTFNIGSMIRTSECFGLEKLYFCGYTPTPDNPKVKKTALNTELLIEWEQEIDSIKLIEKLKAENPDLSIVALETGEQAESIYEAHITDPAIIIVGNEATGISQDTLSIADKIVKIPLAGVKESFNVGVAFGIACYEISRQWNIRKKENGND
ncbi:MAG: TrmH family RNA methyltransferase [Candidatus Cloacimonadia bacterium]